MTVQFQCRTIRIASRLKSCWIDLRLGKENDMSKDQHDSVRRAIRRHGQIEMAFQIGMVLVALIVVGAIIWHYAK